MGANAQTAVPVFTAGQVLTAQQQTEINTGIPVFATTVTRDAAFGGAGEKTLAEGQFAYIEATNTTQYYDGAAWQSVGVAPGLVLINSTAFSSATSFSLPANTFTSTYQNYLVQFNTAASATGGTVTMKFRAAGTDITNSDFQNAANGLLSSGTSFTITNSGTNSATIGYLQDTSSFLFGFQIYVSAPLSTSGPKNFRYHNNSASSTFGGVGYVVGAGTYNNLTAADSLTIINSTASSMNGTVRVYGLANS